MAKAQKESSDQVEKKEANLENLLVELNKKYGSTIISRGLQTKVKKRTGSYYYDYLLGGGIEYGTIATYYGNKGSGKTSMACRNIAYAQKDWGATAAWIRSEKGCSKEYMENIGVDTSKLLVIENLPDGETYFDVARDLLSTGIDILVIDSLTALLTRAEVESETAKNPMGAQARLISKGLKLLNGLNKNTLIILISQVRLKPSTNPNYPAGKAISGGEATAFYSDYVVEFKLKANMDDTMREIKQDLKSENRDDVTGATMQMHIEKNRRGIPKRTGEMYFSFKTGQIDDLGELMIVASKMGLIEKTGGWIKYKDVSYRPKEFKEVLKDDIELCNYLITEIYKSYIIKEDTLKND